MDTIQQVLKRVQPTSTCGGASTFPFRNKGLLLLRCSTVVETGLEALLIAIYLYNHHTFLIRSLPGFKKCVSTQWSTLN